MRMRLWRRRLTISSPRMAIRSGIPWPLRWLLAAVVLGFCGAVALWAFEFGRDIAGLDRLSADEVVRLRSEVARLTQALERSDSVANSAGSLLTAERTAQQQLVQQIRQLETDNRSLRSDLGFFEQLIPASGNTSLSIRGMQVERLSATQLKWQLLLIQPVKNAPEFQGGLELVLAGTLAGKPWSLIEPAEAHPVNMRQYLRLEGVVDVPAQVVVKTATARLKQGVTTRSEQAVQVGPVR